MTIEHPMPFFSPSCLLAISNDPIQRHFGQQEWRGSFGSEVKWSGELQSQSASCDGHQLNPSQQPASNTSERLTLRRLPVASGYGPALRVRQLIKIVAVCSRRSPESESESQSEWSWVAALRSGSGVAWG